MTPDLEQIREELERLSDYLEADALRYDRRLDGEEESSL